MAVEEKDHQAVSELDSGTYVHRGEKAVSKTAPKPERVYLKVSEDESGADIARRLVAALLGKDSSAS